MECLNPFNEPIDPDSDYFTMPTRVILERDENEAAVLDSLEQRYARLIDEWAHQELEQYQSRETRYEHEPPSFPIVVRTAQRSTRPRAEVVLPDGRLLLDLLGGPTGYESRYIDQHETSDSTAWDHGWSARVGTEGRWHACYLPADYLRETSCLLHDALSTDLRSHFLARSLRKNGRHGPNWPNSDSSTISHRVFQRIMSLTPFHNEQRLQTLFFLPRPHHVKPYLTRKPAARRMDP